MDLTAHAGVEDDTTMWVRFASVRDARKFMEANEGGVWVWEGKEIMCEYEQEVDEIMKITNDHQSSIQTIASNALDYLASGVPLDQMDRSIPDRVIVLQQMNLQSSEQSVLDALNAYGKIVNIRLLRDPATNIFAGACFVEMNSAEDAKMVLAALKRYGNVIDNEIGIFFFRFYFM